jgi:hypothetical protein
MEHNAGHFKKGHDSRRAVGLRLVDGKTLAQYAREYTVEAVQVLAQVLRDNRHKPSDRLKAAEYLLDRGWGKAVSVVQMEVNGTTEIRELTREALLALANGHTPALPVTIDGEAIPVSETVRDEEAA